MTWTRAGPTAPPGSPASALTSWTALATATPSALCAPCLLELSARMPACLHMDKLCAGAVRECSTKVQAQTQTLQGTPWPCVSVPAELLVECAPLWLSRPHCMLAAG